MPFQLISPVDYAWERSGEIGRGKEKFCQQLAEWLRAVSQNKLERH
jgi:hypothetical protein